MLSWDQVRHATVFVTPEDDEDAARELPGYTAAQLEEMAKFHRRPHRPATPRRAKRDQMFTWRKDRDTDGCRYQRVPHRRRGRLVNAALEQRAQRMGKDPATGVWGSEDARCADALVELARNDVLDHPGPDPTVVVVHVDADVVDGTVEGNGSIDGIPVPVDTVRRLLCDCEIEYSIDGPDGTCIGIGRAGRNPPRWLRRRLDRPTAAPAGSPAASVGSATSTTSSTGPTAVPPTPTTSSASAGTTTTSSTKAAGPSTATPTTS